MSWLRLMERSIKELEVQEENRISETGGSSVASGLKASQPKKNRVMRLILEMWPAYLIEILVIILGISITLGLEEWRSAGKEKQLENVYQKNLLADVTVDLQSLQYAISNSKYLLNAGHELMGFINDTAGKLFSPEKVESDLRSILGRPDFISSDATFSDLKSSGNLRLLNNIPLKNLLFAYYNTAQNIKELQDAEKQATILISGPYFLRRFPMDDVAGRPSRMTAKDLSSLSTDIEFRNHVLLRIETRNELLARYTSADSLGTLVQKTLSSLQ